MEKTPEEILLKLIEDSVVSTISDKTIRLENSKGWYELVFLEESKDKNVSYYMLYKSFGYNDSIGNGFVFKYQPISNEFMWKHLKGQAPKQELINEIFE